MYLKLFGAFFVVIGCGGFGFGLASTHRKKEHLLRKLIWTLDFMECELQYNLTPLPELCRLAASENSGILRDIFLMLAQELEDHLSPDPSCCMNSVLERTKDLPEAIVQVLQLLGESVGRFGVDGQVKGLDCVRKQCRRTLEGLTQNRDNRLRAYQTLGLCAGAALAILFV